jgi:hypothetical protein
MSAAKKYGLCIGFGVLLQCALFFTEAARVGLFVESTYRLPNRFCFVLPYYMIYFRPSVEMTNVSVGLGLVGLLVIMITNLQMPFYGWILASGWVHRRLFRCVIILAIVHITAAVIAYYVQTRV